MLNWLKRLLGLAPTDRLRIPPPCAHRYVVAVTTISADGRSATQQVRCTSCPHVFDTREVEVRREEE